MRCVHAAMRPSAKARREAVVIHRPEDVVLGVFLARPDDLHRTVDLMAMRTAVSTSTSSSRRPNAPPSRWLWTVTFSGGRPVSLAAAACARVNTCVPSQTRTRRAGREPCSSAARAARARATAARRSPRHARREREPRPHVASFLPDDALRLARGAHALPQDVRAQRSIRAFVPNDRQRREPLFRGPLVVADDGDEIVEDDDLPDAGDLLRAAVVDGLTLPPNTGQSRRSRTSLPAAARRCRNRLAVDLVRRVEALQRFADQPKVRRRLQRRVGRRRHAGSRPRRARHSRACGRSAA